MTQVFKGIKEKPDSTLPSVLTIGNFDGVHLGHQALLEQAIHEARLGGYQACAYTFKPHPQEVLRPGTQVKLLTTYEEKIEILKNLGLDMIVEEPFSQSFFTLSAREFFEKVIVTGFHTRILFVGYDFAFGKNREGRIALLKELCQSHQISLHVLEPQKQGEQIVSSTVIRNLLLEGKVREAQTLLGRPFFYRGVVMRGDQRGRKLGFPTANLSMGDKLQLPLGIYVTWVLWKDESGKSHCLPSVTSIGQKPTFYSKEALPPVTVEAHLLIPKGSEWKERPIALYGEKIEVQFLEWVRKEFHFSNREDLVEKIKEDCDFAKQFFRRQKIDF